MKTGCASEKRRENCSRRAACPVLSIPVRVPNRKWRGVSANWAYTESVESRLVRAQRCLFPAFCARSNAGRFRTSGTSRKVFVMNACRDFELGRRGSLTWSAKRPSQPAWSGACSNGIDRSRKRRDRQSDGPVVATIYPSRSRGGSGQPHARPPGPGFRAAMALPRRPTAEMPMYGTINASHRFSVYILRSCSEWRTSPLIFDTRYG